MRRKPRISNAVLGAIAVVVLALAGYLGFTKDIPFTQGYILNAQFQSANSIRANSPVRIAGVDVGKVKRVEPLQGTQAAVVVLELKKSALPIHADATAKIRPRIFLEGNFFVDLKPGTPQSPQLHSGDTLKITQTATPVQLDQVLTSLQSDSRADLQQLLDGLSTALNKKPTTAQDHALPPSVQGESAAQALNDALDSVPDAERSTAQVLQALLGSEPASDVQRLIRGTARTADALNRSEGQLAGLISNLNTTMAAFAARSNDLSASVRELAPTLATADRTFNSLNAAFPPTRQFAVDVLPGVRETQATIDAAEPWIAQARELVAPAELGGVAAQLAPTAASLAKLLDQAKTLLPQTDLASRCVRDVVLPTGDVKINDPFATGVENYKEFFYALVGLSGEGQNVDGNGMYVRFQTGGGANRVTLGAPDATTGELFGNNVEPPLGNQPHMPSSEPPYEPDVPCYTNALPDLNGPAATASAPGTK